MFDLEDSFHDTPQMAACVERMKGDPEMGRLIAEGYTTPDYDLDELIRHPVGSLAHTYATLLKTQGFNPHFYRDRPVATDADYLRHARAQDPRHPPRGHRVRHAGRRRAGRDRGDRLPVRVPRVRHDRPDRGGPGLPAGARFQQAIDLVGAGIQMARVCKPLMGTRWEDGWEKPVDRWRSELGIQPITSGPNSWYTTVPAAASA